MEWLPGRPAWWVVAAILLQATDPARAAQGTRLAPAGTIHGQVTTLGGALVVAGATIRAVALDGDTAGETRSDDTGRFLLVLPPGWYRLRAIQERFRDREVVVEITAGHAAEVKIELDLGGVDATVTVTPTTQPYLDALEQTSAVDVLTGRAMEELPVRGDPLEEAQRLAAGVIQLPGGVSIKGGRPYQSSVQVGRANVTDGATGSASFRLPWDAIQSVEVLPSPYDVEFGRFSSGVTILKTRSGGDRWHGRANNLIPSLRTRRGKPFDILGFERFGPQVAFNGPLIPGRLFVAESADYRYEAINIRSRPETDVRAGHALSSFTRADLRLGAHSVSASLSVSPQHTSAVNFDTFTPPEAAASLRQHMTNVILSDAALLSPTDALESTLHVSHYSVHVTPGPGEAIGLEVAPAARSGRFYADQTRRIRTVQWIETWSHSTNGRFGDHLFKAGADVVHARFEGERASHPLSVRRSDGTLSRRLTFSGASSQRHSAADIAVFAQDRWRGGEGWLLDAGVRVDRDGALGVTNTTGRAGFVMALTDTGNASLRGGVGLFYGRTPATVAAFGQFDRTTDVRFGPDGRTELAPPRTYVHVTAPGLASPRSLTWSMGFSQQISPPLFVHVNILSRQGRHEFLLKPNVAESRLALTSDGRSRYVEAEVGLRVAAGRLAELHASYTRSSARSDSNGFGAYYGTIPWPIAGANEYTAADGDAPNRFVGRLRLTPGEHWLVSTVMEWRSGLPLTALDEFLDPVLPRNSYRMPPLSVIDLSVERRVRVLGRRPWIGVRIYNLGDANNPADVQRRIDAADFGGTYNARPRQVRLQLRFE